MSYRYNSTLHEYLSGLFFSAKAWLYTLRAVSNQKTFPLPVGDLAEVETGM